MQINVSEYTSPNVSGNNEKQTFLNFLLIVTSLLGYLNGAETTTSFFSKQKAGKSFKIIYRPTFCLTPFYITATQAK
ncbi:MAG: hypothetical protein IPF81_13915 [Bacteroidetes bacterium]|nr:hypothetical protein [Bacteroidota bacterium]